MNEYQIAVDFKFTPETAARLPQNLALQFQVSMTAVMPVVGDRVSITDLPGYVFVCLDRRLEYSANSQRVHVLLSLAEGPALGHQ
jgi:hypothetical protein